MRPHPWLLLGTVLLAGSFAPRPLAAKQDCGALLLPAPTSQLNIFTPQQEADLGDAIAEHLLRNFRVIEDEEVTRNLQRIGDRVLQRLPPTNLRFQFFLFDLPVANAFALPGGRVYVSRKLVAFVRSEDELAGVLAHEIGHVVTRQKAVDLTRIFRELLGVTQVTNRRDIFEKYNRLMDNIARKPGAWRYPEGQADREQFEADSVSIIVTARAGYDPRALAEFWDRLTETKGKTGGWVSDFFGFTKPESRRLREILKGIAAIPAACIQDHAAGSAEEFRAWQGVVVNYFGLGHKEALHAVLSRTVLEPPLRGDLNHLRFSPDGNYVLAQDDADIYVLSREPFTLLFRIAAPEARPAQFTPDSQAIVFHNRGLRVESWSIADQQRTAAYELVILRGCLQTSLSPDGKLLACYGPEFDLSLLDVATSSRVFQKKEFYRLSTIQELILLLLSRVLDEGEATILKMGFSPDARYFVTAAPDERTLAVDLTTHTEVSMPGALKKLLSGGFAFLGPDRLAGVDPYKPLNSALLRFPSGEVIDRLPLGEQALASPARGNYLLLRPVEKFPVGVMNLATKKIFMVNKRAALDVYDETFLSERRDGELGLYRASDGSVQALVKLPRGSLGHLRTSGVSADLKWLAVSQLNRGAIWDLTRGERVLHVRGFRGVAFAEDGGAYADFPKFEQTERMIARMDLSRRVVEDGPKIEEPSAKQYGAFIVVTKPAQKHGNYRQNVTLEVRDTRSSQTLWSRHFPKEAPRVWMERSGETMGLLWWASDAAAKEEIKNQPRLARLPTTKKEKADYLLEVLDARSGNVLGGLLVETGKGSFRLSAVYAVGDWIVVADNGNRILVYSLATGEQKGRFFGRRSALSSAAGLLSIENEPGQLSLYDLGAMQKRDQFAFTNPISLMQFSLDGKRLFVLTANQTAYVLDVSALAGSSPAASSNR